MKSQVIIVKEAKFWHGVNAMRVSLRSLSSYDTVLHTLYEGPFDNKLHFVTEVNSEDLLRLGPKAVVNKLQVNAHEKLAKPVGYLYVAEDALSNGYYNVVEPAYNGNKLTGFTKHAGSSSFDATSIEGFKLRVTNSNYKFLYDEKKANFYVRKMQPVYTGAIVISDLILNKMIFMEVRGEETRLKVTQMKNHGLSF